MNKLILISLVIVFAICSKSWAEDKMEWKCGSKIFLIDIEKPEQSATAVSAGMELYIPLQGLVDLEEEKNRMEKRISEIERLLKAIEGKLSNENFLERAPESVVEKERSNLKKLNEELEKITVNLEVLK